MYENNDQKTADLLSRNEFLKMTTLSLVPGLLFSNGALAFNWFNNPDDPIKEHIAIARALTHKPPPSFNDVKIPTGNQYYQKRTEAIALIADRINKGQKFKRGEFKNVITENLKPAPNPTPQIQSDPIIGGFAKTYMLGLAFSREFKYEPFEIDKKTLGLMGTVLSGISGIPKLPPLAVTTMSAAGTAFSVKSALGPDEKTLEATNNYALGIAKAIWSDPSAKTIINDEVKSVMREVFGIDFDASSKDQKKYLPKSLQAYLDIYQKHTDAAIKQSEDQIVKSIGAEVNKAIGAVLENAKKEAEKKEQELKDKEYTENEIKGGIYLAGVLANTILGEKAGKIVIGLGSAAMETSSLVGKILAGTMGPLGAIAGFVGIISMLASLFSSGPSAEEIILDAIKKLGESINSMREEMRSWFGVVVENQQRIMEGINMIIKQNINNHIQLMQELNKVTDNINLLIQQAAEGRRAVDRKQFDKSLIDLQTEMNKEDIVWKGDRPNKDNIRDSINVFYQYGNEITKYADFTGLPMDRRLEWNPVQIVSRLENLDSVDHFVGLLPMMVNFLTTQTISPINNPKELANAVGALAIAYGAFPEYALVFELKDLHYIQDFRENISNTKESLIIALDKKVILKLKEMYEQELDKLISDALDFGVRTAQKSFQKNLNDLKLTKVINPLAVGPLNLIERKDKSLIDDPKEGNEVPDFSIMRSDFRKDVDKPTSYKVLSDHRQDTAYLRGLFFECEWSGIDQNDQDIKVKDVRELMNLAEKCGIIKQETNQGQKTININYQDYPPGGPIKVNTSADYLDNYTITKVSFKQDEGDLILGDAKDWGWKFSELKQVAFRLDDEILPVTDADKNFPVDGTTKHIQYFSEQSTDADKPDNQRTMSFTFIDRLEDHLRLFCNYRKIIIEQSSQFFLEPGVNKLIEALGACLRYLAGLTEYVVSGDIDLGTAIANGSVTNKSASNRGFDLVTHAFLSKLIMRVTSKEYLYDANYLSTRANSGQDLTTYVKKEIVTTVKAALNDYIDTLFTREVKLNLSELDFAELMLNAAEENLKMWKD